MSKYSEVDMRDNTTGRVDAMQAEIAELRARLAHDDEDAAS